jgi:hypothetical protein
MASSRRDLVGGRACLPSPHQAMTLCPSDGLRHTMAVRHLDQYQSTSMTPSSTASPEGYIQKFSGVAFLPYFKAGGNGA